MTQFNARCALVSLTLLLSGFFPTLPSEAQANSLQRENAALKTLLPIYRNYVRVVQAQGTQGIRKLAASDFTLRGGGKEFRGAKAFAEISRYADGLKGAKLAVTVEPVTVTASRAVVFVKEAATMRIDATATGRASWFWKQAWRKTPQGWKLTLLERAEERKRRQTSPVTLTISG